MEQQLNSSTMFEAHNKKLGPVQEYDIVGSFSSSSCSSSSVSTTSSGSSSLEFDSFEEVTSPSSSSSTDQIAHDDPLSDMSSLIQQLPIKRRGLSRHYQGKSQSFTSLANVRSLEDLAKPENPYNKKLKYSRSFGGGLSDESQTTKCTGAISVVSIRHVPNKRGVHSNSRGSCSSLSARRGSANSFMGSRPPIPPHRSTSTSTIPNQTVLFA